MFLGVTLIYFRQSPPEQPVLTMSINPPDKAIFNESAISPNGKLLAFTATSEGKRQLWIRPLHALTAQPIAGTDQAECPFWSPDNRWIGFFAQGKLKTIGLAGGPPQSLCDAVSARGGSWGRDGTILFSASPVSPILRIASTGGSPVPVTKVPAGVNEGHRYPSFRPDGRHFLFNVGTSRADAAGVFVGSLDGGEPLQLLSDVTNALYTARPGGRGLLVEETAEALKQIRGGARVRSGGVGR